MPHYMMSPTTRLLLLATAMLSARALAQDFENPEITQILKGLSDAGGGYQREVVSVSVPRGCTDDQFKNLRLLNLRHVQRLNLTFAPLTNKALQDLHFFTELRELDLAWTKVTDDAVEHLCRIRPLRYLRVSHTAVTGARFKELSVLTELTQLDLTDSKVSLEGMKQLKYLESLQILELESTQVNNAGVAALKPLVHLSELHLANTEIVGAGGMDLEWAKSLTGLSDLTMSNTRVDDRCIAGLGKLPNLQFLDVAKTKVTAAGLCTFAQLKRQKEQIELPIALRVSRGQVNDDVSLELSKTFTDVRIFTADDEK